MGTIPIITIGRSVKFPSRRSSAVRGVSPAPKSLVPLEICLIPSVVPMGKYCNWTVWLLWLYRSAHLRKSGRGTLDPAPTRTTPCVAAAKVQLKPAIRMTALHHPQRPSVHRGSVTDRNFAALFNKLAAAPVAGLKPVVLRLNAHHS